MGKLVFEGLAPRGDSRTCFWVDAGQWCALHTLFYRSGAFSIEELRRMADTPELSVPRRQALKLGLRLRKLLDENPAARVIAARCCSCRLLKRAHAQGFLGQVFELDRDSLDRFADFAISSVGFRLIQEAS